MPVLSFILSSEPFYLSSLRFPGNMLSVLLKFILLTIIIILLLIILVYLFSSSICILSLSPLLCFVFILLKQGRFIYPTPASLAKALVVATSCTAASQLLVASFSSSAPSSLPACRFSHIIIDEAAQAMEAEACIPLSLCDAATQFVLCGDPCQLGPSVRTSPSLLKAVYAADRAGGFPQLPSSAKADVDGGGGRGGGDASSGSFSFFSALLDHVDVSQSQKSLWEGLPLWSSVSMMVRRRNPMRASSSCSWLRYLSLRPPLSVWVASFGKVPLRYFVVFLYIWVLRRQVSVVVFTFTFPILLC